MAATKETEALTQRLRQNEALERQQALRTLLLCPLCRASGKNADEFANIRKHVAWLREWLNYNTGWTLLLDSELARLHKSAADPTDTTRAATDPRSHTPLDKRRFVQVCLCLAALQEFERQTVLRRLAERVAELSTTDPGIVASGMGLNLIEREHRRDFVQVIRLLMEIGVLARVDGDEEQFVQQTGDALYNINRSVLASILSVRRGPSTISSESLDERIVEMQSEADPDTDEGRARRLRWALTRRLLDDPVVYYDDLTDAERQYLFSQRSRLMREIEMATGLIPEVRAEGIAMVDPSGSFTDLDMPEEGTDGHAALLTAQWLAEVARHSRERRVEVTVPMAAVTEHVAKLIQIHRRDSAHWRKGVEVRGYDRVMAEQIVRRLEALRLVRVDGDLIVPRAAIARYHVDEPVRPLAPERETFLWTES